MVELVFDKHWVYENIDFGKIKGDGNIYTTGVVGRHKVVLAYMPDGEVLLRQVYPVSCR